MQRHWKVKNWKFTPLQHLPTTLTKSYKCFVVGIRPETIAEFIDIYKMDYEMFSYRKPAILIDVGESLLAA